LILNGGETGSVHENLKGELIIIQLTIGKGLILTVGKFGE
jgi:hypothetical protein